MPDSDAIFTDSLRTHDEAFVRWLRGLTINYGTLGGKLTTAYDDQPILIANAAPHLAYASIANLLDRNAWFTGLSAPDVARLKADNVIPLPFATWTRPPFPDVAAEGKDVAVVMKGPVNDIDPLTGRRSLYPFPGQYTTTYTVRFWCNRKYTMSWIGSWLNEQFGVIGCRQNERLIPVDHPAPFGTCQQAFAMTSSNDESDLEAKGPAESRMAVTFTLRTHMLKKRVQSWGGMTILDN